MMDSVEESLQEQPPDSIPSESCSSQDGDKSFGSTGAVKNAQTMDPSSTSQLDESFESNHCLDSTKSPSKSGVRVVKDNWSSEGVRLLRSRGRLSSGLQPAPVPESPEGVLVEKDEHFPKITGSKDVYCWECHKSGVQIECSFCPRAFHVKCLGVKKEDLVEEWRCTHCCSHNYKSLLDSVQLRNLLKAVIDRLKDQLGSEHFLRAVDTGKYPNYRDYVVHPFDLSRLEHRVIGRNYTSAMAFLNDLKWIFHNSVVYNGLQSPITSAARTLIRVAKQETDDLMTCSECYYNAAVVLSENWFTEACGEPHVIVWAKMKSFPFWPAKVLRMRAKELDIRFFGEHTRAWLPETACYLFSREFNQPQIALKKDDGSYQRAMKEVELHLKNLTERFGPIRLPPMGVRYRSKNDRSYMEWMLPGYIANGVMKSCTEHPEWLSDIDPKRAKLRKDSSDNQKSTYRHLTNEQILMLRKPLVRLEKLSFNVASNGKIKPLTISVNKNNKETVFKKKKKSHVSFLGQVKTETSSVKLEKEETSSVGQVKAETSSDKIESSAARDVNQESKSGSLDSGLRDGAVAINIIDRPNNVQTDVLQLLCKEESNSSTSSSSTRSESALAISNSSFPVKSQDVGFETALSPVQEPGFYNHQNCAIVPLTSPREITERPGRRVDHKRLGNGLRRNLPICEDPILATENLRLMGASAQILDVVNRLLEIRDSRITYYARKCHFLLRKIRSTNYRNRRSSADASTSPDGPSSYDSCTSPVNEVTSPKLVKDSTKSKCCGLCNNPASWICCLNAAYCSEQCQEKDWTNHQINCVQYCMEACDIDLRLNPVYRKLLSNQEIPELPLISDVIVGNLIDRPDLTSEQKELAKKLFPREINKSINNTCDSLEVANVSATEPTTPVPIAISNETPQADSSTIETTVDESHPNLKQGLRLRTHLFDEQHQPSSQSSPSRLWHVPPADFSSPPVNGDRVELMLQPQYPNTENCDNYVDPTLQVLQSHMNGGSMNVVNYQQCYPDYTSISPSLSGSLTSISSSVPSLSRVDISRSSKPVPAKKKAPVIKNRGLPAIDLPLPSSHDGLNFTSPPGPSYTGSSQFAHLSNSSYATGITNENGMATKGYSSSMNYLQNPTPSLLDPDNRSALSRLTHHYNNSQQLLVDAYQNIGSMIPPSFSSSSGSRALPHQSPLEYGTSLP